jgi:hypothetical protein
MPKDLFDYVEQIRGSEKFLDLSLLGISRLLMARKGKCHLPLEHDVTLSNGDVVTTELYFNVNAASDTPTGWSMSLKLHEKRIDGFDWEKRFPMLSGDMGRGWHRHHWDAKEESAEDHKLPVSDLETVLRREQFLIRGLALMKVRLSPADHGQDDLLLLA